MLVSNELSIRKKSLLNNSFPNQELIDEFLIRKESVPSELDLKWKKPKIVQFVVCNLNTFKLCKSCSNSILIHL